MKFSCIFFWGEQIHLHLYLLSQQKATLQACIGSRQTFRMLQQSIGFVGIQKSLPLHSSSIHLKEIHTHCEYCVDVLWRPCCIPKENVENLWWKVPFPSLPWHILSLSHRSRSEKLVLIWAFIKMEILYTPWWLLGPSSKWRYLVIWAHIKMEILYADDCMDVMIVAMHNRDYLIVISLVIKGEASNVCIWGHQWPSIRATCKASGQNSYY